MNRNLQTMKNEQRICNSTAKYHKSKQQNKFGNWTFTVKASDSSTTAEMQMNSQHTQLNLRAGYR